MSTTATPQSPERVTKTCDVDGCGEEFEGPAIGPSNALYLLNGHKWRKHGIRADGTRRGDTKTAKRATKTEDSARPVIGLVRDVVEPMDRGSGPPSEDQLTRAGGRGLQLLSLSVASLAAETEDDITDAQRDEIVAYLALTDQQAREIVRPIAHLAQPTKINRKFGRTAVENVDALASVLEIGELCFHWTRYLRQRRARRPIALGPGSEYIPPPAGVVATDPVHAPGGTATPAEQVMTSGAPHEGVVVDATMVQRLQGGGRG